MTRKSFKPHNRQYDVVVFGATGYTGQYAAESITAHLPSDLKWAVAGRSEAKLKSLIKDCQSINPDRLQPEIEVCELTPESLAQLAKKTFVLITTVGPYSKYGEPAFKACAENGTHYLDVTGEIAWTHRMLKKYEAAARATGAILVPQNGIESAPADLLTWALAKRLRTDLSAKVADVTVSLYELNAAASGGTLNTALDLVQNNSLSELRAAHKPYALSPVPNTTPRPARSLLSRLTGVVNVPHLGLQTTSLAGSTDAGIVCRTWGLLNTVQSKEHHPYGPKFTFSEYYRARSWVHGVMVHYTLATASALLFFFPPFRWLLKKMVFQPGQGPDREEAKKETVEYRGVAKADSVEGKAAFGRATYSGSMYMLSGHFLSHAALVLLEDDLGLEGGVYTPAMLGQPYVDRLEDIGFQITTEIINE